MENEKKSRKIFRETYLVIMEITIHFHFQVVPNAIKEWERALNVKRSQTPIFLNRKCRNSQYFSFDEDPGEQVCM